MRELLLWCALGAWANLLGVWAYLLALQIFAGHRFRLRKPENGGADHAQSADPGRVRIIVPVRNIGADVEACLNSVLGQKGADWRLTVVDDRSTDDTGQHVRRLIGRSPHAESIRIEALPPGWLGKSHALWTAARLATEHWLLFLDDDCVLQPEAVRQAVAHARSQGADLLTLWPRHLAESFWEKMIIPLCGGVIALWFGSSKVNDDHSGARAFANGQFLLFRREAYLHIDGHACVRDAIIEDVPLAEAAKRAGLRCRVACGADLFGVRMYHSYRAIVDGWARIFIGALRSGRKLAMSMGWLVFGNLWPFVALPVCLAQAWAAPAASPGPWRAATGLCVLHLGLILTVSYRFWGLGRCDRRHLWLYPVSVVVVVRILAEAWFRQVMLGRICWRDTTYSIDTAGRIRPT